MYIDTNANRRAGVLTNFLCGTVNLLICNFRRNTCYNKKRFELQLFFLFPRKTRAWLLPAPTYLPKFPELGRFIAH